MPNCELCGEPMPAGEEMFKYHGYSGPCPKPRKAAPAVEIPQHDPKLIDFLGFAAYCADATNAKADLNQGELLHLWKISSESVRIKWRFIADAVLTAQSLGKKP